MNSRKIRVAAGAALVFGLLSWIPAGAVTIGYPPAEPGGRCLSGFSVPLSGASNQLYKCVNNQWAVVSTLDGGTGPAGATGAPGTNGTNGVNGAPGEKGDKGDTGNIGPAGPALAAFGMNSDLGQFQQFTNFPDFKNAFVDTGVVPPAGTYAVTFEVQKLSGDAVDARCRVTIGGNPADDVSQPIVSYLAGNNARGSLTGTGWITVDGSESVNVECTNNSQTLGDFQGLGQNLTLIPLASVTVPI